MKKNLFKTPFLIFIFFYYSVYSENIKKRVDIVSYDISLLAYRESPIQYKRLKKDYDLVLKYDLYDYVRNFRYDDPNLKKIVFIDYCQDPKVFNLPKKKIICFKWEAIKINPYFYKPYSRVYTFDDDLVDGKKFFKFYYPVLKSMLEEIPSFEEKKLCTMVVGNWKKDRLKILKFFLKKPSGEFEFYGRAPKKYCTHEMFKGSIEGYHSSRQKLETIKNYRFYICFENTHTTKGYITEKIFDVFTAGCVPIYWGPSNVEDYIPINCFIDYRNFKNDEEMYKYIKSMPKEVYEQYLKNIKEFLKSDKAYLFSVEYFENLLYEAINI